MVHMKSLRSIVRRIFHSTLINHRQGLRDYLAREDFAMSLVSRSPSCLRHEKRTLGSSPQFWAQLWCPIFSIQSSHFLRLIVIGFMSFQLSHARKRSTHPACALHCPTIRFSTEPSWGWARARSRLQSCSLEFLIKKSERKHLISRCAW